MSGSYDPVSPPASVHRDKISTMPSPAAPQYYSLGDVSKASGSRVSSTQNGQGWGQDEAIAPNLPSSGFDNESKTSILQLDTSQTNLHWDHTNAQREKSYPRRPVDDLEDLEIHLPVLNDEELRSLDEEWHPSTQLRKLLFKGAFKWLMTVIFVIVIYCVLFAFSKKPVMDDRNKKVGSFYPHYSLPYWQNRLSTCLSLDLPSLWALILLVVLKLWPSISDGGFLVIRRDPWKKLILYCILTA